MNPNEIVNLSKITLYRILLKSFKIYPSVKRHDLLVSTIEEFHDHKTMTDPELVHRETVRAQLGVAHVLLFIERNRRLMEENVYKGDELGPDNLNMKKEDYVYF